MKKLTIQTINGEGRQIYRQVPSRVKVQHGSYQDEGDFREGDIGNQPNKAVQLITVCHIYYTTIVNVVNNVCGW